MCVVRVCSLGCSLYLTHSFTICVHAQGLPAELALNKKLQNLDLGNNVITRWSDLKVRCKEQKLLFLYLSFYLCEKMFPESWLHSEIGARFIGQSEKSQSAREPYC